MLNEQTNQIIEHQTNEYKFNVSNRNYLTWSIYDNHTFVQITDVDILNKISPYEQKLLNDDQYNMTRI